MALGGVDATKAMSDGWMVMQGPKVLKGEVRALGAGSGCSMEIRKSHVLEARALVLRSGCQSFGAGSTILGQVRKRFGLNRYKAARQYEHAAILRYC